MPGGMNAKVVGGNLVVAWNPPPQEDVVVEYRIYRSATRNFAINGQEAYAKVKATSYEDVGAAGSTYYYKIVAVDPSGNESPASAEVSQFGLTGVDDVSVMPTEFALYQNYPNPFNPTTTITYDLPDERQVSLKVFNMLGQEVATLVDARQSAGHYTKTFSAIGGSVSGGDAKNLASGLYIYKLTAGTSVSIKKMSLIK
jgi:hypothetical protein